MKPVSSRLIRAYLSEHHLEDKINCVVTFYGVPFRVCVRVNTTKETGEQVALTALKSVLLMQAEPFVREMEEESSRIDGSDISRPPPIRI